MTTDASRASHPVKVRLTDVAAAAGVSPALVSIVMRDAEGASSKTRARVRAIAEELGYSPDQRARMLRQNRSRTLGVSYAVHESFHGDLIEKIYSAASALGYQVVLSAVTEGRDELTVARGLVSARCEGIILLGSSLDDAALASLDSQAAMISIGRVTNAIDHVSTDDAGGARLAVDHLVGFGHRDIVHFDGGNAPSSEERRNGYLAAIRSNGLEPRVVSGGEGEADGAHAMQSLMADLPTAVISFNDRSAIGAMGILLRAGVTVPTDVSIVGFDNGRLASLPHVNLTTIGQDPEALATAAVARLGARLDVTATSRLATVLPASLVVRSSTGRARSV
ncbi:MAG: LacI family transcriptional regulator [Glaciihabitans sp.]|nr:LacI family transcriptional regulator [Glaciihabitans sp.]